MDAVPCASPLVEGARKRSIDVVFIVRCIWMLVSGALGIGKDNSIGRTDAISCCTTWSAIALDISLIFSFVDFCEER